MGETIDQSVDPLGTGDLGLQHLDRRELALPEEGEQIGRRHPAKIVVAHLRPRRVCEPRRSEGGDARTEAFEDCAAPERALRQIATHSIAPGCPALSKCLDELS